MPGKMVSKEPKTPICSDEKFKAARESGVKQRWRSTQITVIQSLKGSKSPESFENWTTETTKEAPRRLPAIGRNSGQEITPLIRY